jgi:hypothetical protein
MNDATALGVLAANPWLMPIVIRAIENGRFCSGGPEHYAYEWAEVLLALHDHRAPHLSPRQPEWILEQCLPGGERQETA